jgi:hypothetical protein
MACRLAKSAIRRNISNNGETVMVFLELAELLISALILLVFTTQIFIPLWKGEKLFPIFRKKLNRLNEEVAEAKEEIGIATTKRRLKKLKKTVQKIESEDESDD